MNGSKALKFIRRILALFCAFALLLTSVDGRVYASDPAEKESSSVEEVANKPLSVIEAKTIENNKDCTVEGYIVGSLISGNLVDPSASQSAFNLALADARNQKNPDKIMPIYLADSNFMKILNVKDHPENLGKRIKLTGKRQPYFKQPGLILITAYEFVNDPAPDNSKKKVTYKYWGQTTTEDVVKGSKPTSVPASKNPHKATQSTWSTIVGWHVEGSNEKVDPAQTAINQDTVFVAEIVNKDELRVINQSYFRSGMAQYTGLANPEIYEGFAAKVTSALQSTTMSQAQVDDLVKEFRVLQKQEILGNKIRIDLVDENKKVIHDQATVELRLGEKRIDTIEITNGSLTTQKKYPNGQYTVIETKAPAGYSIAQHESITIDVSGALAYQQAPSVHLTHADQTMATFSYENAPEGMRVPADMTPDDGKVILPEPEASSDPAKSFLFWKDPTGNTFQPGVEVEVEETTNFVGVWGKNYWKIRLDVRYADGERIMDKEIEDLGLAFKVVGSDGVAHDPWEVNSSLDTVTFFKDADGRYYFIRGDYKIIVDDSKSDYEVKEALFEEKPFDLKKDLVSVPGKESVIDTSSQSLEIRIQKKEVKATFSYENAPEGMKAPANMTPEDGKIILPEPEASSDPEQSFLFWKDPAGNTLQPGAEVEVKETTNFVGVWGKNYWKIILNLRYANGERITDKEIEDLDLAFKVVGSDGVAHDPWEVKSSLDTVTFFKDADGRYYFIRGDYKIVVDDSKSDYEVKEALFEEKPFDLEKNVISVPGQEAFNDTWTQALEVRIQKKDLASIPVRVEVREDGKRVDSVSFQVQAKVNGVWIEVDNPFSYNDNKQGEFENPLLEGEYRLKALGVPEGKKLVVQSSPNNMAKEIASLKDTFSLLVSEENKGNLTAIWAMFDLVEDDEPGTDPSDPGKDPSEPETDPSKPGTDPTKPSTDPSKPGTDHSKPSTESSKPGKEPSTKPNIKPSETDKKPGKTIVSKNHGSGSPSTGDFSLVTVAGLGLLAACGLVILNKKKEVR